MPDSSSPSFCLVGIGASAGGLEALESFFDGVPADSGLAFAVVQHLSPDFKSMMGELLSRHTGMKVLRVEDRVQIEPNHVYLIPPKKEMIVSGGRLLLTDKEPSEGLSLPIDTFLKSLGQEFGASCAAVILSGTGSDGSRGVRTVSDCGGLVIAQDVASAQFDGMSKSAVDTGCVDLILAPSEMGAAVVKYANGGGAAAPRRPTDDQDGPFNELFALLRDTYGLDFGSYKTNTVTRRIERRVQLLHEIDLGQYLKRLSEDTNELELLYRDLLIGVTRFFRDPDSFDSLGSGVLPEMFRGKKPGEPVRAWVAACGTGEEAYSVAMLLEEQAAEANWSGDIKVFATDVHKSSVEFAGAGLYTADQVAAVDPIRLKKHFTRQDDRYQISPRIRQMVVFAPHNVMADAPFTNLDLVTCRNMLIYLTPDAQQKVLSLFHFALRTGGTLFLGSSESPGPVSDEFQTIDTHAKLYRKRRDVSLLNDVRMMSPVGASSGERRRASAPATRLVERQVVAAYEQLARDHVPPSYVIDRRGDLVYSTAGSGRFLKQQEGFVSSSLLELVDPGLKLALAGVINRAARDQQPVRFNGVKATESDAIVDLVARPIELPNVDGGLIVVSVQEQQTTAEAGSWGGGEGEGSVMASDMASERIDTLETELRYTRENLQATIEELETSNEELQASNEELVASNEELQSTNEELHSVNEELHTVNAEHQKKIDELTELTDDMENLFQSTDIATLFLDEDLRIRRFSPKLAAAFQVEATDIGRKIDAFSNSLDYPGLIEDLQTVLDEQRTIERDVRDDQDRPYLVQLTPYRSSVGTSGVVVALIDLALLEAARADLRESEALFRSTFENAAVGIARVGIDGTWLDVNQRLCDIVGYSRDELMQGKFQDITDPADLKADLEDLNRLIAGDIDRYTMQKRYVRKDRRRVWVHLTVSLQRMADGSPDYYISVVEDISKRKRMESRLRDAIGQRDRFLATMSHELRNPLAALLHAARLLRRDDAEESHERAIEVVMRRSTHIANLLDDLLDLSRITQGKIRLSRRVVDLRPIVKDAVEFAFSDEVGGRHDLETHLPEQPVLVDADATRMLQIIQNLLSNAFKYTPPGRGVAISLSEEAGEAVIAVRDHGKGIDPVELETIFDMFAQSSQTEANRAGGMGLGLTLVRSLAELHGGSVAAHSDGVDAGSTFTVRLPICSAPRVEVGPEDESPAEVRSVKTVVLVEDEADAREMLAETLRLDGFEVVTAANGDEGLATILQQMPEVALVDVALPGLSGYEIAKQVRKTLDTKHIRLVAMTGFGRETDRKQSRDAGFDLHLVKPVKPDDLAEALKDTLDA